MTCLIDWLEQAIENNSIDLIKFDGLNLDAKKRKKGGSHSRPCVDLNGLKFTYHTLTDFDDINIDEDEMKTIFSTVLEHENIIKAFISQSARSLEYYLLIEIANQGNLVNYLEKTELTWDKRINLASQLIKGLEFLHNQQIVHSSLKQECNLTVDSLNFKINQQNPKNVLLHDGILKLTNFGGLTIFKSDDFENIPYVEPQALTFEKGFVKSFYGKDHNSSNIYGDKSNIYSLGVLLWQISSGIQPFKSLLPMKMVEYISRGEREEPVVGTPVKYCELYQDCWQYYPGEDCDKRPDCLMAFKKLEQVDMKEVISVDTQYEDTSELDLDINNYYKLRKFHSAPSLCGESTLIGTSFEENDDTNNIQEIYQESDDFIIKFLSQQWNIHKGLKVYGNTFIYGEEILTEDGTITPHRIKQLGQIYTIYTNKPSNIFENLKNECVSIQNLEEIDICLHIPLLNIDYENFKISDEFVKTIEEILKNPDQKSIRGALQKAFEKYGDYIAKKVIIGGALRIKSAWPKDRKSLIQDFDILKANLHWISDQIISGKSNVFGQVPYDNIFRIEDTNNPNNRKIISGHELKSWMEDFYGQNKGHVIAFNEIIPTYTLLKDEIKQEIIKVCGELRNIDYEHKIVPYITNNPIPEPESWTESSPMIYLCHWINDLHFNYGLTVQQSRIRHGLEIALEFLDIPEICLLDKSYMHLRQPISKKEAFTLANHIKIDDINVTEIPFLAESLTNLHPIFDNQHKSNEIHCFIASEKIKLTFNKDKLRPSESFSKAVDKALDSDYPFCNLKNIFDKFGYFCPQNIILGITFSKIYKSDNNNQFGTNELVEFNIDGDESRIIEKLIEWNESIKDLDTFFLDFNGDIVNGNEIYSRLKNFHEKDCKTVIQDLIPLYKILPKAKQNDIESIASDNYHIVMTGSTKITRVNQTHMNIQFENPLQDNNYEIFGYLFINEQKATDVMIRFNLANQYGCRAYIHKLDNKSIPVGAKVFWIILDKGHGYFSRHSRDIKIDYGRKILTGELPTSVEIPLHTWSNSCIFITNFESEDFDKNQIIKSRLKHCSMTSLSLDVFKYSSEKVQNEMLDYAIMRWCVIDTNENDYIKVDVGENFSTFFEWRILGDVIKYSVNFENDRSNNKNFMDHAKEYSQGTVYMAGKKVVDVVAPYIPLFDIAVKLIKEIIELHDAAQYNKNICARLMVRVIDAQGEIEKLKRTKKLNESKFKDQNYYNTFQRFNISLTKIKTFEEELSKMVNFRKTVEASLIKEKFMSLTDEFDTAMRDLSFSMMINNEEQRKEDFRSAVIDKAEEVRQEVQVMKSHLVEKISDKIDKLAEKVNAQYNDKTVFKPTKIEANQLQYCHLDGSVAAKNCIDEDFGDFDDLTICDDNIKQIMPLDVGLKIHQQ
ncbi:9685_t:CDS:2, partial [Scutellospora calospora]